MVVSQVSPLHDSFALLCFALLCGPQDFAFVTVKLNQIVSFGDGFFKLPYRVVLLSPL